jgi:hypothetical protein
MKSILAILLLVAATLGSSRSKADQEKPSHSVSPDKQWEFRRSANGEKSQLIKRGTTKVVLDLSDEDCGEGTLIWAPDSKRFALNCYAKPTDSGSTFYQLRGSKWTKLDSLADKIGPIIEDATSGEMNKKYASNAHEAPWVIMDYSRASRWINTTTLIVRTEQCLGIQTDHLRLGFVFTVQFDAEGNWKIVKTSKTKNSGWTDDCFN